MANFSLSEQLTSNSSASFIETSSLKSANGNQQLTTETSSIVWQLIDVNVLLTVVYLAIFFIGVIGNACNCLVIADSRNKYMKTATNYYLFSLSVSDLLLLIFGLPHDIVNLWHPSPYLFNQFVCISRGWISEASTYASVLVIVAFTVERYLAICHPLKAHTLSRLSRSIKIIVLIWLVASSCALMVVMQYGVILVTERKPDGQDVSNAQCTTVDRNETIFELSVLIFFIIPMAVITILYVKLGYHLRQKTFVIKQNQLKKRQRLMNSQAQVSSNNTNEIGNEHDYCSNQNETNDDCSSQLTVKVAPTKRAQTETEDAEAEDYRMHYPRGGTSSAAIESQLSVSNASLPARAEPNIKSSNNVISGCNNMSARARGPKSGSQLESRGYGKGRSRLPGHSSIARGWSWLRSSGARGNSNNCPASAADKNNSGPIETLHTSNIVNCSPVSKSHSSDQKTTYQPINLHDDDDDDDDNELHATNLRRQKQRQGLDREGDNNNDVRSVCAPNNGAALAAVTAPNVTGAKYSQNRATLVPSELDTVPAWVGHKESKNLLPHDGRLEQSTQMGELKEQVNRFNCPTPDAERAFLNDTDDQTQGRACPNCAEYHGLMIEARSKQQDNDVGLASKSGHCCISSASSRSPNTLRSDSKQIEEISREKPKGELGQQNGLLSSAHCRGLPEATSWRSLEEGAGPRSISMQQVMGDEETPIGSLAPPSSLRSQQAKQEQLFGYKRATTSQDDAHRLELMVGPVGNAVKLKQSTSFMSCASPKGNKFQPSQQQPGCRSPNGAKGGAKLVANRRPQPIALNSTMNTASMQSVIKMLVSVVVMFFICWAPFHAQRLMAVYVTEPTSEQEFIYSLLNHISGISYYISAVVNPILYSLFSVKFRQAFRDTFGSMRICSTKGGSMEPVKRAP